ncbi:TonB-dependent receptor [uncultured Draconibacterium sp.]|uniref:SusC/RagA family TonB-linked outer membrane protein n=1 Tax=uncultured Draconibacterium sp. TaxID=1573823 RepID=UPI0029C7B905|nr:TonB-dependent receptor [uncultured Draconibacterium sp.]
MNIYKNKYIKNVIVMLFFVFSTTLGFAQETIVKGKITDSEGGLPGVNVIVKGTSGGTITDMDGNYEVKAPADGTLVFSFVGFETTEVNIKGRKTVDIQLEQDAIEMEELVVVGYGTQKKRDLTGAISSVNSEDIMRNTPTDVANALQGKVSGVEVISDSGEPGAGSRIRIRGTSTFTTEGASPLFIVDGMEIESIDAINPQDIESMEVLKDAASASIYGSKSANGVIIITTKKGAKGKPRISVNYKLRASEIAHQIPQINTQQSFDLDALRNFYKGKTPSSVADSLNPVNNNDFNYQDLLHRRAWTHQLDMSIAGGNDKLSYYMSVGYLDEQGIYIKTFNKRLSSRVNVDYAATDKLKIGTRVAMGVTKANPQSSTSRDYLRRSPYWSVIDPDGEYTAYVSSRPNPVAWANLYKNDRTSYDFNVYNYLEYDIIEGLQFKSTIAGSLTAVKMDQFRPALLTTSFKTSSMNEALLNTGWTHEDLLTYRKNIKDHSFNSLLGFSMQERRRESVKLDVEDNLTEAMQISTGFQTVDFNNTKATDSRYRMSSFFARVNYSYKSRYLLTANIRRDGSSRFGINNRWGNFPSVSAGWRFSDESFMDWTNDLLTDGKFRASFGITGNQAASNFASLALYSTDYYSDQVGFYAKQLGNPLLGWETTQQMNYGLDLTLLDGRVILIADYYNKKTNDILYNINIPQTTGFKSLYQNVGDVENKGIEFSLTTVNIKRADFKWKTTINFSKNNNIVTSVPGGEINDAVYTLRDGWTIGTMFGYKAVEIFPWDESNAFTPEGQQLTPVFDSNERFMDQYLLNGEEYTGEVKQILFSNKKTPFKGGDVHWEDVNNDGIIDSDDRTIIGNGQPDFFGSFVSEIEWKRFTLSAIFNYSFGGDVYNYTEWRRSSMRYGNDKPSPILVAKAWKAPGDVAEFYALNTGGTVNNPRPNNSLFVEDGSYIRLQTLRLGYDLPSSVTSKLRLGAVSAYVIARNFFTWTNYSGWDPEVNTRNSVFAIGYDEHSYPRSKDVIFGLNINF